MNKRLFEVEEIAEYLGVTTSTLYSWVSDKEIPYVKMGRLTKFDLRRIDAWILENSVEPVIEEKQAKSEIEEQTKKECSNCFKEKPLEEFYNNIRGKNGRSSYCKICADADTHKRHEEKKKLRKEALKKEKEKREQSRSNEDKQICKICGKEKHIDEFYKDSRLRNGRTTQCKVCVRVRQVTRDRKRKSGQPRKIQVEEKNTEEKEDEKEKVPWAIGGECEILNSKGEVIFKNGKAYGKEGEEWLRKKKLLEEKKNE